ncbi:MAG: putative selenate reductase subunit YgfK [Spirochaetota bacterium]|nr:MAG: putative selenate reductase subunit YgfK [Spirochaetota bacterium]
MTDTMKPIAFNRLLRWISEEFRRERTIFGIPEVSFFRKESKTQVKIFDEICDTPIGPAAGPHTQLTQNIVSAFLVGGRFIELKTVQKLDDLEIEKPCIDARDEGYNTEWSQELSLEQSLDEYIKAWILLHFLGEVLGFCSKADSSANGISKERNNGFIFNMSVGYDLEGIKNKKMDWFISGLKDASENPLFSSSLDELDKFINHGKVFQSMGVSRDAQDFSDIPEKISPIITRSVTLSTMHGCPPHEIEGICKYLMKEKGLDTFVKLNPTLLGFESVRETLDTLGFGSVSLKEESFTHDLQWKDALGLLTRLLDFSKDCGRHFGVKLSNTLGTVNTAGILPGEEMYMSGRALFPLTVTLASLLSGEFKGALPISYSGGASELNIAELYDAGIKPITMATDLLKPGGYMRLKTAASMTEPMIEKKQSDVIDVEKLDKLAQEAIQKDYYKKRWKSRYGVSVEEPLPLFDCYVAPCVTACPIHQDIPTYLRFAGEGQYKKALERIYIHNALPDITGHICDHQCQYNCTRLDYEGQVRIREVKRISADKGKISGMGIVSEAVRKLDTRAAVIGAGPAGLAASFFLSKAGFQVTVFEKQDRAGGVLTNVLPGFRLPDSAVKSDISFIEKQGVTFRFGISPEIATPEELKKQGYKYIFIAIGAEISRALKLRGDNTNIYDALDFLRSFRKSPDVLVPGRRVAVIGGGNTAMDSARAVMRLSGVEEVSIVYRRTEDEMPADREEFENALADGVVFMPLLLPESFSKSGVLRCRMMTLGTPDESGRRAPVPTENIQEIEVDTVISAIGEHPDLKALESYGLKPGENGKPEVNPETLETEMENVFIGGDAYRGPSTVVESMADAKRVTDAIVLKEIPECNVLEKQLDIGLDIDNRISEIYKKKGRLLHAHASGEDRLIAENEARRCLECNIVCNKCIDVCPNRANIAIRVDKDDGFNDRWQILHLDSLCNECGNCETFCPYDGAPYKDKITLFSLREDFNESTNKGFMVEGSEDKRKVTVRMNGEVWDYQADKDQKIKSAGPKATADSMTAEATRILSMINSILTDYGYLIY